MKLWTWCKSSITKLDVESNAPIVTTFSPKTGWSRVELLNNARKGRVRDSKWVWKKFILPIIPRRVILFLKSLCCLFKNCHICINSFIENKSIFYWTFLQTLARSYNDGQQQFCQDCFRHFVRKTFCQDWASLGHNLGNTLLLLGHYLRTTWALFGHKLGTMWALLGHYMGTTWTILGH